MFNEYRISFWGAQTQTYERHAPPCTKQTSGSGAEAVAGAPTGTGTPKLALPEPSVLVVIVGVGLWRGTNRSKH